MRPHPPLRYLWLTLCGLIERLLPRAKNRGAWGERWAVRLLRAEGCRVLARNARPYRHGELDLVAKEGRCILFVEVKTRQNERYGRPLQAISLHKRRLMRQCATHWLAQHHLLGKPVPFRFEAIEVIGSPGHGRPILRRIRTLDMSETRAPELF